MREKKRWEVWNAVDIREREYMMMHAIAPRDDVNRGNGFGSKSGIGEDCVEMHTENAVMDMDTVIPHVLLPRAACEVLRQRMEKAYSFDIEPRLVAAFEPRSLVRTALKGAALGFAKPVAEWFRVCTHTRPALLPSSIDCRFSL